MLPGQFVVTSLPLYISVMTLLVFCQGLHLHHGCLLSRVHILPAKMEKQKHRTLS